MMPRAKVVAGGLGATVATALIWLLQNYGQVELPADVAAAFTGFVATVVAYLVPEAAEAEIEAEVQIDAELD